MVTAAGQRVDVHPAVVGRQGGGGVLGVTTGDRAGTGSRPWGSGAQTVFCFEAPAWHPLLLQRFVFGCVRGLGAKARATHYTARHCCPPIGIEPAWTQPAPPPHPVHRRTGRSSPGHRRAPTACQSLPAAACPAPHGCVDNPSRGGTVWQRRGGEAALSAEWATHLGSCS